MKLRKQMDSGWGFSLLELMIVIVVASILLAIAMPAWEGFGDRGKVRSAAQALAGDLTYARSESLARGTGASLSLSITPLTQPATAGLKTLRNPASARWLLLANRQAAATAAPPTVPMWP